ncbi:MAG: SDR family oxidoreductase [Anaerolineae bacterium]|nr:SDR family oxidoreductase [Anaerolineae bacterium]
MELNGKVAIVTGGAVRLGRAMALALAERGAQLVVHYNASAGPAEEVVRQIEAEGGTAVAVQADLSQARTAPSIVEAATARFGRVDILVNSAAIFEPGSWDSTTEENWDRHFDVNLKSPFFLIQAFARQIGDGQRGHIVNIADWRGVRPGVDHVAYTLTKAALIAMTRSMALALAPDIQINAIAPGMILPPPGKGPEFLQRSAARIPLQRIGSPGEIVKAMLFLLDSDFVTGELIYVTGGESL